MKARLLIAAGVMAVAASLAGPSVGQDQNLTINGVAVPADQLEGVTMKCEELLANRATALAQPGDAPADPAAPAAAADNAAVAEATPAPSANGDAAAAAGAATAIDLETLTADICEAGGFTPDMD